MGKKGDTMSMRKTQDITLNWVIEPPEEWKRSPCERSPSDPDPQSDEQLQEQTVNDEEI